MADHGVHSCEYLSHMSGSEAMRIVVERKDGIWSLFYRASATEDDVRAGEADSVGEVLTEVTITIRYCPFCGRDLQSFEAPNG